jgi:hypothetical protein
MPRALSVGQLALVVVGDDLVHDPVDGLSGRVCCSGWQHVHRHRAQPELAGRHGAALTVAHFHHAIGAANRGNRCQDTVFGDTVEEGLVQVRIFAHIVPDF